MGRQHDKKILRFLSEPTDYSFDEADTLLTSLGHHLQKGGNTAGSATTYVNENGEQPVRFHKPHQYKHFGKKTIKSIKKQVRKYKLIENCIN
jgi:hypothetical protein